MTDADISEMLRQHAQILDTLTNLWTAEVLMLWGGLMFIALMLFAAAWSVRSVNRRQDQTERRWEARQEQLEQKWVQLVDLLIHNVKEHGTVD